MSSTATPRSRTDETPAGAFTSVLNAAVSGAAAMLEKKVVVWADKLADLATGGDSSGLTALADAGLDHMAEGSGGGRKAGAEAIKAHLRGQNPVWPAIKGAWQAGTPVVRAAVIAAVASAILLLLLAPVPLLVFLVSLLVIATVQRARKPVRSAA